MELIGKRVRHKAFGDGIIVSFRDGKVTVSFETGESRHPRFQFPEGFEKHLSFSDEEDQKMLMQILVQSKVRSLSMEKNNAGSHELMVGGTVVKVLPEKKHERLTRENMKTLKAPYNINNDFEEIARVLANAHSDLLTMESPIEKPKRPLKYQDKWSRGAYALRYHYAYIFEYINMFVHLLDAKIPDGELKVLSIGCGAKIDAWAFQEALRIQRMKRIIHYTGVDKEDWSKDGYCPITENNIMDESTVYNCTGGSFLIGKTKIDYDIIVFPKSLGDISLFDSTKEDFYRIKKALETIEIDKDYFYLVSSTISYDDSSRSDVEALEEIINSIEKNGFKLVACYKNGDCNRSIVNPRNYVKYPEYPKYILNDVERLTGYKPIFSRKRENYYICKFEKVGQV